MVLRDLSPKYSNPDSISPRGTLITACESEQYSVMGFRIADQFIVEQRSKSMCFSANNLPNCK